MAKTPTWEEAVAIANTPKDRSGDTRRRPMSLEEIQGHADDLSGPMSLEDIRGHANDLSAQLEAESEETSRRYRELDSDMGVRAAGSTSDDRIHRSAHAQIPTTANAAVEAELMTGMRRISFDHERGKNKGTNRAAFDKLKKEHRAHIKENGQAYPEGPCQTKGCMRFYGMEDEDVHCAEHSPSGL